MKDFEPRTAVSKNRLLGLFRLMTGYRLRYVVAAISTGLAACSQTATYLLLGYFIDSILPRHNPGLIILAASGFIGCACFQGTFSFVSGRCAAQTAEGTIRRLRNAFFDQIQKLPFSYHDKTPTGDLIERATSDMDAVRKFYAEQAIGFGRVVLLFGVNFTALLTLSTHLGLVSVAVIPVVLGISVLFFRSISKRYEKFQEQEAILSTTLQENLTGIRVVKAFARQAFEVDRFEKVNWEKFRRGRRLVVMNAMFWPLTDLMCGFQMLAGFMFGATLALRGDITVGTYVAFVAMIGQLIWPIRFLGRLIVDISSGLVSYTRVTSVLAEAQEPLEEGYRPTSRLRGELEFRGVCFGFDSRPVLHDISFRCEPGNSVAFLGSTGSGKTSLVNLVPRFHAYGSGSITLDGRDSPSTGATRCGGRSGSWSRSRSCSPGPSGRTSPTASPARCRRKRWRTRRARPPFTT